MRYTKWKMAVQRSLGWVSAKKSAVMTGKLTKLISGNFLDVNLVLENFRRTLPAFSQYTGQRLHNIEFWLINTLTIL